MSRNYNNTTNPSFRSAGTSSVMRTEFASISTGFTGVEAEIDLKADKASPTFSGTVALPATTSIGNVSAVEIATLDGVTSAIQTQLDLKALAANGTHTGTTAIASAVLAAGTIADTPGATDSSTKIANMAAVQAALLNVTAGDIPVLPADSGKFLTNNGTIVNWADAKISNVVTATTATTLTSTGTLLQITPTSYGVAITLPDATTCSVGGPMHIIDNNGAYPVRVQDASGVLKGFIFAGVVSHISLIDNSAADGVWAIENSELVGASAQLLTTNLLRFATINPTIIDLGSNRELLIGANTANTAYYAVVYDKSTNTFGSQTLVRTVAAGVANNAACLVSTDKVLFVSSNAATAFEAVCLTINGTTITVNIAATATLSAAWSTFADGCGLIAVGSSFVCSYRVSTQAAQIRALSISGTTVTIGAATVLQGIELGLITNANNTGVISLSYTTTTLYTNYYGVSGSTLTTGTGATSASGSYFSDAKLFALGTRWGFVIMDNSAGTRGGVISLSGTTVTQSIAVIFSSVAALPIDAIVVGSNKVLVLSRDTTSNANIMTDTAGTASVGTAINLSSQISRACLYASGTDVFVYDGEVNTLNILHKVDCSGASPVKISSFQMNYSAQWAMIFSASNSMLKKSADTISGSKFVTALSANLSSANIARPQVKKGILSIKFNPTIGFVGGSALCRGKADSERWIADGLTVITKVECVI